MKISYLFSDTKGDILLGPDDLVRPFLISPQEQHAFLCLGDYFAAVENFVLQDNGRMLMSLLESSIADNIVDDNIDEIIIRSEKHGVLYHIASIEIIAAARRARFAVTSAVGEDNRAYLEEEYGLLAFFGKTSAGAFLPKVYCKSDVEAGGESGRENISMFLSEWLATYCEWHLVLAQNGRQEICVWDNNNGNWLITMEEGGEIFGQAAEILTLFYDTRSCQQIYPWHHGAGDFVVRKENGSYDVKLISVRQHEAMLAFAAEDTATRITALISFFLNLALRMRLDKVNGTGEPILAEALILGPVVAGFFRGLTVMQEEGRYHAGAEIPEVLTLLKAFSVSELNEMHEPLLEIYSQEDPDDFALILSELNSHCQDLHKALNNFQL